MRFYSLSLVIFGGNSKVNENKAISLAAHSCKRNSYTSINDLKIKLGGGQAVYGVKFQIYRLCSSGLSPPGVYFYPYNYIYIVFFCIFEAQVLNLYANSPLEAF